MRPLLIFLAFYSNAIFAQDSLYSIAVNNSSGSYVPLSNYKGYKIIACSISSDNLKKSKTLKYWDSLQKANPNTRIILMPAGDLGASPDTASVLSLQKQSGKNIMITNITQSKKDKGGSQNALLQWLTHSSKNHHFDADVETDGQLYVISESGVLYAVLSNAVSQKTINEVLKQTNIK